MLRVLLSLFIAIGVIFAISLSPIMILSLSQFFEKVSINEDQIEENALNQLSAKYNEEFIVTYSRYTSMFKKHDLKARSLLNEYNFSLELLEEDLLIDNYQLFLEVKGVLENDFPPPEYYIETNYLTDIFARVHYGEIPLKNQIRISITVASANGNETIKKEKFEKVIQELNELGYEEFDIDLVTFKSSLNSFYQDINSQSFWEFKEDHQEDIVGYCSYSSSSKEMNNCELIE